MHLHVELVRDRMRLVDAAGSRAPDVDLLQGHDIRLVPLHQRDHALEVEAWIASDRAMDVPGHHPDGAAQARSP